MRLHIRQSTSVTDQGSGLPVYMDYFETDIRTQTVVVLSHSRAGGTAVPPAEP